MNQKTKNKIVALLMTIFRTVFLFAMCYIILKPFISIILSGFMSPDDLRDIRVEKIPLNWSFYYWKHAWSALGIESFLNSLYSAVGNTVLQVITAVPLPTAVTNPLESTLATSGSELSHTSLLSVAVSGSTVIGKSNV